MSTNWNNITADSTNESDGFTSMIIPELPRKMFFFIIYDCECYSVQVNYQNGHTI